MLQPSLYLTGLLPLQQESKTSVMFPVMGPAQATSLEGICQEAMQVEEVEAAVVVVVVVILPVGE